MNEQNLTYPPIRTAEEAVTKGRAGGIASGEARREKRTLRQIAEMLSERHITVATPDGKEDVTFNVALVLSQFQKAIKGDTKAAAYLTNLLGEQQLANVSNTTIVVKTAEEADKINNLGNLGV